MEYLFTSDRLGYRLLQLDDINVCALFWGDEEVMAYCGGSTSDELLPHVIAFYEQSQKDNRLSVYAVVELATNKVIGAAGFNIEHDSDNPELIFHFIKDAWNKGYATEAAIACLNYAYRTNLVQKVTASSSILNKEAISVLGKIGFQYIGIKYFEDTEQEEAFFELVF
ncbi:GNAT family N-acetyltransferase [Niallia sp. 01092]|uniref:GNAT family N-acetyltransferase n=1 Tax=unclassified Niallia TaxID=2837522 RepID=UPI003FD20727